MLGDFAFLVMGQGTKILLQGSLPTYANNYLQVSTAIEVCGCRSIVGTLKLVVNKLLL